MVILAEKAPAEKQVLILLAERVEFEFAICSIWYDI